MKYIIRYNESSINYYQDWMKPNSPIRTELEIYLNDILMELKDQSGFRYHISGWIDKNPAIWIGFGNSKYIEDIDDVIHHIKSYLDSEGFKTWDVFTRDGKGKLVQLWINFDKK